MTRALQEQIQYVLHLTHGCMQVVMLLLQNAAQPRILEATAQLRTHLKLFDYSSLPAPPAFQVQHIFFLVW